jgi:hypothetical protein
MYLHHPMTQEAIDRFWSKVNKTESCWIFTGKCRSRQYAIFNWKHNDKTYGRSAHRLAWELINGEIPPKLQLCHDCPGGDNPKCCNPDHLFPGTAKQNEQDKLRKGRHRAMLHPESYDAAKVISDDDVVLLRELHARGGWSERTLGQRFGISPALAGMIVRRKRRYNVHNFSGISTTDRERRLLGTSPEKRSPAFWEMKTR